MSEEIRDVELTENEYTWLRHILTNYSDTQQGTIEDRNIARSIVNVKMWNGFSRVAALRDENADLHTKYGELFAQMNKATDEVLALRADNDRLKLKLTDQHKATAYLILLDENNRLRERKLCNHLTEFKMLCDTLKLDQERLYEQRAKLLAMVKKLEWGENNRDCCLLCNHAQLIHQDGTRYGGHASDCPLAALLKECWEGKP